jgi:tetratricopeptide (TPR) repeat protein
MLLAAALALPCLDNHRFWDDEANTAIYARNLLRFGRITAWDGTNLSGYGQGGALGEDLGQELRVPTLPAYVAAASMRLLGETTFAGRLPFVLAGIVSVGLLAVWLRRHLGRRFPVYLPAVLLAVSPAFLLYIRNCRYYALGVLFTLAVYCLWAPGASRSGRCSGPLLCRRELARWAGAAAAMLLLAWSHYLNAAALLATLPLWFLDRRYRQRRQYLLLAVLWATGAVYAAWVFFAIGPQGATYGEGQQWLFAPQPQPDSWHRFWENLGWFLRDLGTHEFFPWLVVAALPLPFLMAWWRRKRETANNSRGSGTAAAPCAAWSRWSSAGNGRIRRLRPLAWRGGILVAIVLAYVVLAAALMPADMGKGPTAEMRYVVPLVALGGAVGGVAVAGLCRVAVPAAAVLLLLLAGTNWLHLGFLVDRFDGTNPAWPPTLYRYVYELGHPFETGSDALIELLDALPAGTTVRIWPSFMTYPPMFYVPELHYCDQLTTKKRISSDLRGSLPDYLFVERSRPEVVVVPAPFLLAALNELEGQAGPGGYRTVKATREHYNYVSKPEIPLHCFRPPEGPWSMYPGFLVLVAAGSALEQLPALVPDDFDRKAGCEAHFVAACQLHAGGQFERAIVQYEEALRLDPRHVNARVNLGDALQSLGRTDEAAAQYRRAIKDQSREARAHYNLANLLRDQGEIDEAEKHYRAALDSRPNYPYAHAELAKLLLDAGKTAEARDHLRAALRSLSQDDPLAREIRRTLRQIER